MKSVKNEQQKITSSLIFHLSTFYKDLIKTSIYYKYPEEPDVFSGVLSSEEIEELRKGAFSSLLSDERSELNRLHETVIKYSEFQPLKAVEIENIIFSIKRLNNMKLDNISKHEDIYEHMSERFITELSDQIIELGRALKFVSWSYSFKAYIVTVLYTNRIPKNLKSRYDRDVELAREISKKL